MRHLLEPRRRVGVALIGFFAAIVLVASVSGLVGKPPAASASPFGARASANPTATPSGNWDSVQLGPDTSIAELTVNAPNRLAIPTRATFQLRSRGPVAAAQLATGLRVQPPMDFAVLPGSTADAVSLKPKAALVEGVQYRFRLYALDGSLAGTWAFRTSSPLHVVDRLPDDRSSGVPTDTGIEVGFDQDSPTGFEAHFSIQPSVAGRFESHNRTWVFVPTKPLAPATLYTVTVTHGVGIAGSDQVLESDVRWGFETAPTETQQSSEATIRFDRSIVEIRPGTAPDLLAEVGAPDEHLPTSLTVQVYRLPNASAARSAALVLLSDPGWAVWSSVGLVKTADLDRVASVEAPINVDAASGVAVVHVSTRLDAGWYLAVVPRKGRDAQVLLQVTDLAVYAVSTETRTLAWINDLGTVGPVEGAVVTLPSGATLGRSDASGLIEVATPTELRPTYPDDGRVRPSLLTTTDPSGRQLLIPLGLPSMGGYPQERDAASFPNDSFSKSWSLFATDRTLYRQTDTVHVWGLVRERADRSVPTGLELRLHLQSDTATVSILRLPVVATPRGVIAADLPLRNLPLGNYDVDLFAGSQRVATVALTVGVIRKPAYSISVTTDQHAYIAGSPMNVTSSVAFFDGTAAPGLQLRLTALDRPTFGTTDTLGRYTTTVTATAENNDGLQAYTITAAPALPEEGEISAEAQVYVFPSRVWLEATGSLTAGRVVVDGRLTAVDLSKVEREIVTTGWPNDPSGAAVAGGSVSAEVIHLIPVKTQVGTTYDFITKKVVPSYEYSLKEQTIATLHLVTDAAGNFHLSIPAPVASDDYRVELDAKDAAGRSIRLHTYVSAPVSPTMVQSRPYLDQTNGCGWATQTVGLNDSVDLTVHETDGRVAASGQYLFLVGEQGLRDAVVQTSSTFSRTFRDADLPNFIVGGVRFSARGFDVTNTVDVRVAPADKTLKVTLTPDRARYAPQDRVTIDIATTDASGRPIASDVIVRGVDEKLFSIGAASDIDALATLMASRGDGFLQSFTSHPIAASSPGGGCGDTGGGRDDFRDFVTFQRVSTDASGHGSVTFTVPDDLTSWHVSATALSGRLDAGSSAVLVPVGLPFFVDAILAPDYLAGDVAVLRVRAFGDALKTGDPVRFTIEAPSLGLAPVTIAGRAFESSRITLPKLTLGDHRITIHGTAKDGSATDVLVRTVHVISSRLTMNATSRDTLGPGFRAPGGDGLTTYVITDAGRGALLPLLQDLAASSGARFDAALSADVARALLVAEFDVPDAQLPPSDFALDRYERGGLTLLPYASPDLFLTARAALVAPDRLNASNTRDALQGWLNDSDTVTRERRIVALAGLAGLGDDVLTSLLTLDDGTLTIRERLWLALGLLASGDEPAARALERSILTASGQRLGPWVRLNAGSTLDDTMAASALLLMLAGGLGDPIAADVSRYLADQPSHEALFSLEQLHYARAALDRLPRTTARFAWTVDGARHEVTLEPGGSFSLTLTADQRRSLTLEQLAGSLIVSSSWLADATTLPADPSVSIARVVTPSGDAPGDQIVHVRLTVTFTGTAPDGCYRVTDLLPSGLAPLVSLQGWPQDDQDNPSATPLIAPYDVTGQQVSWCVDPTEKKSFALGYSARVVSPGTYRWEPAVVESVVSPALGSATPVETYTIR